MRILSFILLAIVMLLVVDCNREQPVPTTSLQELAKPASVFKLLPGTRTIIKGELGTKLKLKGNEFEFEDGTKVKDTIVVELREVYDKAAMIFNGITTTSDGKLIESIGMFEIRASSEGKPLKIRQGRSIEIFVPNRNRLPDGELFYGERDSTGINWVRVETEKPLQQAPMAVKEPVAKPAQIADSIFVQSFTIDEYGVETFVSDTTFANDSTAFYFSDAELAQQQGADSVKPRELNAKGDMMLIPERPAMTRVFRISQLGWINVDRIIEIPIRNQVELLVTLERYKRPVGYIIFKDFNSVMPLAFDNRGNALIFGLPLNSSITLLTVDYAGDQLMVTQEDVVLSKVNKFFFSPEDVKEKSELTNRVEKLML